jgi:5-methyltetrahydropteroyltriglutamate--homocysteine methyltransferase
MIPVLAYQHGIYPRSEALVAATRDLERGRISAEAVSGQFDRDLAEFALLQERAGLDYVTDGMLRWPDLFRPLVAACPGLEAGPLLRWFDTNSFYRAPVVRGDLGFAGPRPAAPCPAARLPGPRAVTLPSPYLFSRVADYAGDRNDLMLALARDLLQPLARQLVADGARLVHLQEPWLGLQGIGDADWKPFAASIGIITDGLGATTVLHACQGDASGIADQLAGLPVDVIGLDFTQTDPGALGRRWPGGILAGCLDGRRSLLEQAGDLASYAVRLAETLRPAAIYLSSAGDLSLLPETLARQKVAVLGEAACLARQARS